VHEKAWASASAAASGRVGEAVVMGVIVEYCFLQVNDLGEQFTRVKHSVVQDESEPVI
jgi:hypothetical protein